MDVSQIAEIANLLPDSIVVIDDEGRLKWANAAAERLLGMAAKGVIGQSTLEFVHPEDADVVTRSLASIRGKGVGTPIEIRVRAVDGWKLVELVGTNLLSHPRINALVLSIRDLTERRRWEVARDEVSRFRALVHNAATIIMLLDASGIVQSVSAAITRLLGHDQELIEGHALTEIIAEEDRGRVAEVIMDAVHSAQRSPRRTTIEVNLLREGERGKVPFELHIVNLLDDPTVAGLVVSGHDITALRRSLDELAKAQAELVHRERLAAVGELASMVGHELRNPLGAATNFLYLARMKLGDDLDAEVDDFLSMVERQTNRAAALSEDLTTYVREHKPEPAHLDFNTVVEEVLRATPPPQGVRVELEGPTIDLEADPTHLAQMLTNLVVNAYQAMPDGGSLRIGASATADLVEINVKDSGSGIDPEIAKKLFDPFFTTKTEGTGLGLSIVRRLARSSGGSIVIDNVPSGGALATLRLPRRVGPG